MNDFLHILPEIILALTLVFVIAAEITYHGEQVRLVTATAIIGLGGAFVQSLIGYERGSIDVFGHSLVIDGLTLFFRLFFILLGIFAIAISAFGAEIGRARRSEYCALILAAVLSMCFAASAADMIFALLCLQFANLLSSFIAAYRKGSIFSTEAAVKYLLMSVVGGTLFLYGLAVLFSATQTLNIYEIHHFLLKAPLSQGMGLSIFMLSFLALQFQVAGFPMHLWAPDVLEGAPTPASAFLALGARVAGFAVALRFLVFVFAQPALNQGQWQVLGVVDWPAIVSLLAGLTAATGSLLALRQSSAKRLMGCLVVAGTGHLLIGLLVLDQVGINALLYNLVVELFSVCGIFFVLTLFYDKLRSDRLVDLKGVLHKAVPETIALLIFLFSFVGIPPSPSFFGKFALVDAAVRHGRLFLALSTVVSLGISAAAVARLAFALTGGLRANSLLGQGAPALLLPSGPSALGRRLVLGSFLIPIVLISVFSQKLLIWAGKSLSLILW